MLHKAGYTRHRGQSRAGPARRERERLGNAPTVSAKVKQALEDVAMLRDRLCCLRATGTITCGRCGLFVGFGGFITGEEVLQQGVAAQSMLHSSPGYGQMPPSSLDHLYE